jgi:hypothetical protein
MEQVRIANGTQVPSSFGSLLVARRKSTVQMRNVNGEEETFQKSWGTLTGKAGEDLILFSEADPDGYPIKIDIFEQTYEETEPGSGQYRKTATSSLVQVPEGVTAILETKEGEIEVQHPDYVVIGAQDEVYANKADWVSENLEFIS